MRPPDNSYSLGFTSLALRPELARIVAEAFRTAGNWEDAKASVLSSNALQARTATSANRLEREIRKRLMSLSPQQLELLVTAPMDACSSLAWLSVLKTTPFIMSFTADVLRAKLEASDRILRRSDYENFFSSQAIEHPELNTRTPTTKAKLRAVLLAMLRDVGILVPTGKEDSIQRPVIPSDVYDSILADNKRWLAGFLVPDSEIATLSA